MPGRRSADAVAAIPADIAGAFAKALLSVVPDGRRIGVAVSGGPDSLALLLLAARVRPGAIEAATVDHCLRAESRAEAEAVAEICADIAVPHQILTVDWPKRPETAVQERARAERYALLAKWAAERDLDVLATAHHQGDQSETLLMRLARGSGLSGLSGIRALSKVPGSELPLARPLLDWPKGSLEAICAQAAIQPLRDPSNQDSHYERVKAREALAANPFLSVTALGRSASNLADADTALEWTIDQLWEERVDLAPGALSFEPVGLPKEVLRRLTIRAIVLFAIEGQSTPARGKDLDRLLLTLSHGKTATLKGVRCAGGVRWTFAKARPRQARPKTG